LNQKPNEAQTTETAPEGDQNGQTGQTNQRSVDLGSVGTILANLDAKFARKTTTWKKATDKNRTDRAK